MSIALKIYGKFVFVVCCALIGACSFPNEDTQRNEQEIARLTEENKQLKQELNRLRDNAARIVQSNKPSVPRLDLHPSLGDSSAKIAILEFSDYQCPFCARHNRGVFRKLKEKYIDKGLVQYQAWDFPLDNHSNARSAAVAVRCAQHQGKFWEIRNRLFAMNGHLSYAVFNEIASELNVKIDVFSECLSKPEEMTKVVYDISYGKEFGITATPSFLVGEVSGNELIKIRRVRGAKSLSYFDEIISSLQQGVK